MNHLDTYNYPSKYKQQMVDLIVNLFGIHRPYKALAPKSSDRACFPKHGCLRIFKETFYAGFRLPPPPFVFRLLAEVRVCPTQLQPNSWRFIYCFLVQVGKHYLEPSVSIFRYMFKFANYADNTGWIRIQHRILVCPCLIFGSSPDSLPECKKEWFYIQLEEDNWDNFFRPDFSRAV